MTVRGVGGSAMLAGFLAWMPAPAAAQDLDVFVNGGVAFPADPPEFSEFWRTGFTVGAGIGVRVSPSWELVGAFHFQRFPADEEAQVGDLLLAGFGVLSGVTAIDGRDAKVITMIAEARYHFRRPDERTSPFLAFGTGYFEISTTDATVTPVIPDLGPVTVLGDTDAAFGATVGAGLELALGRRVHLILDSIYTIGFTEIVTTQHLPVRIGLGVR